jgi:hypothetical protein
MLAFDFGYWMVKQADIGETDSVGFFERNRSGKAMASRFAKFLDDGRANEKGVTEGDVSASQLEAGEQVEHEHTPDKMTARRVALDHLSERPKYYTELKKMESQPK